ncbi:MAG: hypothetical protein EAZ81_03670 [Verrucomicrobia bacterium]|nr:MAG: hypothetical protein EAZ81_03670 [Verrucomicrobiota bacterium]
MAQRDPELTQHNKAAAELTAQLKDIEEEAIAASGRPNLLSLHAAYGGKNDVFIDIKNAVIHSADQFVSMWLEGYMRFLDGEIESGLSPTGALAVSFRNLQKSEVLQDYVFKFLKRTYHRNYRSLNKVRPAAENAFYWIGQERANYGIFVTPRFRNCQWENDKSEIRHFRPNYWTVGHVLQTGLVIPFKEEKIQFNDIDQYLSFFRNAIVRLSGSPHELNVADFYCEFVRAAEKPEDIPLLIPELRYGGIDREHQYRLDFCVVREDTQQRIGFELSPWSTHGYLKGLKGLNQTQINELAKENFEKEMRKVKTYFSKHGIFVLLFTDQDLTHPAKVFDEIKRFLDPVEVTSQLKLSIMDDFRNYKI